MGSCVSFPLLHDGQCSRTGKWPPRRDATRSPSIRSVTARIIHLSPTPMSNQQSAALVPLHLFSRAAMGRPRLVGTHHAFMHACSHSISSVERALKSTQKDEAARTGGRSIGKIWMGWLMRECRVCAGWTLGCKSTRGTVVGEVEEQTWKWKVEAPRYMSAAPSRHSTCFDA